MCVNATDNNTNNNALLPHVQQQSVDWVNKSLKSPTHSLLPTSPERGLIGGKKKKHFPSLLQDYDVQQLQPVDFKCLYYT